MQKRTQYQKEWRQKNAEQVRAYRREYAKKNREKVAAYHKAYHEANKAKICARSKAWYENNTERAKQYARTHGKQISERMRTYFSKYYAEHRDELLRKNKDRRATYLPRRRELHEQRLKRDPQYKAATALRARIMAGVRAHGVVKARKTIDLLGCTYPQARAHIEVQWKPGMSWDNHGEWHIDHIVPLSHFDLSKEEEQCKAFHYTNLQPLWAHQNLKKHARLVTLLQ